MKDLKAITLKYDSKDNAPEISSKGRGRIAEKIIEIAEKNNIPIYEDDILAEILNKMDIGCQIPEYLFEVIAEVYAYTYELMRNRTFNYE